MDLNPALFAEVRSDWNLERLYADLADAKHQVAPHTKPGWTVTEKERLRGLLCGFSPAEIAKQQFKQARTVEVALCQTLYRYVETLTGRSHNALESWRDVASWLAAAGYQTSKTEINWSQAPDVSVFYGRQEELGTLQQWITSESLNDAKQSSCRLVALIGPAGMGKTALVVKLTNQIQSEFDCLIWQSLRHAPTLERVLGNWLQPLLNDSAELPPHLHDKISCLTKYLRDRRCLIVLDSFDTLLNPGDFAGHYREGYENYGELLRRIGEEQHQSCLLVTSRESTKEIVMLEGPNRPVRSLELAGLGQAGREILKEALLSGDSFWDQLIRIYRGNPLVLKLVSTTIRDLFNGNVAGFLKQGRTLITTDLIDLIGKQVERLSTAEKAVLRQLAENQEPLDINDLKGLPPLEVFPALESLVKRSLVEKSAAGFTLRPVVMEYVRGLNGNSKENLV